MTEHIRSEISSFETLRRLCRVTSNINGDSFVGLDARKYEGAGPTVNFPLGYALASGDDQLRLDIIRLFEILTDYNDTASIITLASNVSSETVTNFPFVSYMILLSDYLHFGSYKTEVHTYVSGLSGLVNWSRTIDLERSVIGSDGPVYPTYQVRRRNKSDATLISEIYNYCIYLSSRALGWLFGLQETVPPFRTETQSSYVSYLSQLIGRTYRDREQRIFVAMLNILTLTEVSTDSVSDFYGTHRFEYIWERLVDNVFGNINKEDFFPRTYWKIKQGGSRANSPLEPDTIMRINNDLYILDAKYYRYGVTFNPAHLPGSSSINKQIAYADYVAHNEKFSSLRETGMKIYSAFLLPFDSTREPWGCKSPYLNVGEASADWETQHLRSQSHQRVRAILVDSKRLIRYSSNTKESEQRLLAETIRTC